MKQINTYINEKANFLVKKHMTNLPKVAMSIDELEDGCYAKITSLFTTLIKYSKNNTKGKIGYYWIVWKRDANYISAEVCNATNTSYLTNEKKISHFNELTDEDYAIINYMETHELKHEKMINIKGKY